MEKKQTKKLYLYQTKWTLNKGYLTRDKEKPRNSSCGYLSEETQNTKSKRHIHPYVHCSIIYNSQDMEAT